MATKPLHNERALLLRITTGDESSFQQVFEHYKDNVYTTVLRMTGSVQVAEEVLQDTFLKVWLKKETLHEVHYFAAWVYTIAENLTYNAIKVMQRKKAQGDVLRQWAQEQLSPQVPQELIHKEYEQILRNAVLQLPPKQQETYRLIKEQHLKRDEVAALLNVTPETVKWNLDQAMRSIRAYCIAHLDDLVICSLLFFL